VRTVERVDVATAVLGARPARGLYRARDLEGQRVHLPPEVLLKATQPEMQAPIGGARTVKLVIENHGGTSIDSLRVSFLSRLDLETKALMPAPRALAPGQSAELVYRIEAPRRLNPTCEYNSIAYAHMSALYRRAGAARLAHVAVKVALVDQPRSGERAAGPSTNPLR